MTLSVFNLATPGAYMSEVQNWNIPFIVVTLLVFHFDTSDNDSKFVHLKNI